MRQLRIRPGMPGVALRKSTTDHYTIHDMVRALKPVLNDRGRAERILERFWADRIALIWNAEDVHRAANEREVALTRQMRQSLHQAHPAAKQKLRLPTSSDIGAACRPVATLQGRLAHAQTTGHGCRWQPFAEELVPEGEPTGELRVSCVVVAHHQRTIFLAQLEERVMDRAGFEAGNILAHFCNRRTG